MKKQSLIFIHIPKTAGSTLGHPLHRQYSRSEIFLIDGRNPKKSIEYFKSLPNGAKSQYLCISGHMPFGLHEFINGPAVYATILRDPISRVISLYNHHYLNKIVLSKNMNLLDFVSSDLSTEIYNDQTRRLSGKGDNDQVADKTPIDESIFNVAITNMEMFFPVVGLTEAFDESLLLMKDEFGWENIYYTKRKVAKFRPSHVELNSKIIDIISERNFYDIKLYIIAKQKLETRIKNNEKVFKNRLFWFNKANRIYNQLKKIRVLIKF